MEKRIRHPASLLSFLEEKNNNNHFREGAQDVKIMLLDVFPPHFLSNNGSDPPIPNGTSNNGSNHHNAPSSASPPAYIAATSIIIHGKQMGMLVIGRNIPFSELGITLLSSFNLPSPLLLYNRYKITQSGRVPN